MAKPSRTEDPFPPPPVWLELPGPQVGLSGAAAVVGALVGFALGEALGRWPQVLLVLLGAGAGYLLCHLPWAAWLPEASDGAGTSSDPEPTVGAGPSSDPEASDGAGTSSDPVASVGAGFTPALAADKASDSEPELTDGDTPASSDSPPTPAP